MLGYFLDSALTQPITRQAPKQFLVSTQGGTKTTSVWLGDPDAGVTYVFGSNISVRPVGAPLSLRVSVKRSTDVSYGFPGTPILFPETTLNSGVDQAVRIDLQVEVLNGPATEFGEWGLETNGYRLSTDDVDAVLASAVASCLVIRRDTALRQRLRTLPQTREVFTALPGFRIGEYRWRDQVSSNAKALVPTQWDPDITRIGSEKFVAGIGANEDLAPIVVSEIVDSLYPWIHRGHYFTGPNGYYFPATPVLDCVPAHTTALTLSQTPTSTCPIFVGTYQLDRQGFYEHDTVFRRVVTVPDEVLSYDWYAYNPTTRTVTLSRPLETRTVFLGTLSSESVTYFDVPIYPVDGITRVYVDRGLGVPAVECTGATMTFDRAQGTVVVSTPEGVAAGEPVYATVTPAVAVWYESGTATLRRADVDLNPAFAGISSGYVYLQHRRQKPESLVLSCDKPLIAIPPTHDSVIGLVAYGPVDSDGDYALLTVTAYSQVPNEVVPNARLRVVADASTFAGLVNYQDPLTTMVDVVTGGDGTANLVFLPAAGGGVYIPTTAADETHAGVATTTVSGDTLVLPTGIPISQIWNAHEGWLVTTYSVTNNHALFGKVGGDPVLGETVWQTSGTAGYADYRTNGLRDAFRTGRTIVRPIHALDVNGVASDDPAFTGTVTRLVFAEAIPSGASIGAYYVTYLQRVTLKLQAVESNVVSNSLLLEITVPPVLLENPWLVMNDASQGVLNQFRLGGPSHAVNLL